MTEQSTNKDRTARPTLRRLLGTEAFSEAQVAFGDEFVDWPVSEVVYRLRPRQGSLLVADPAAADGDRPDSLDGAAGVVLVMLPSDITVAFGSDIAAGDESLTVDGVSSSLARDKRHVSIGRATVAFKRWLKICKKDRVPLVLVPAVGDMEEAVEDIRRCHSQEIRRIAGEIQADFLNMVMEDGLEGVARFLLERTGRPVSVENSVFKQVAAINMSATPSNRRQELLDKAESMIEGDRQAQSCSSPLRVGKRAVIPLVSSERTLLGFLSTMVRSGDDLAVLMEFMQPAALAAVVYLSQKEKGTFSLTAASKDLLRQLMSGGEISTAELEQLERHFGFDLADGFLVFAVELDTSMSVGKESLLPDGGAVSLEIEGTFVLIVPFIDGKTQTWQDESNALIQLLKRERKGSRVQLGAGRKAMTMLDLPEAYRQARQALIIGSMMYEDKEFAIGYGDLGVKRLLYLIVDHPELERFYKETLVPLEEYDKEWETDHTETLKVYLEQGANLNSAARTLYIHRHTLRYRLEQIADILKVDIDSQEDLLNLQVAFLIRQLKGRS